MVVIYTAYMGYGNFVNQNILLNMKNTPISLDEAFNVNEISEWSGGPNRSVVIMSNITSWVLIVNLLLSFPVVAITIFGALQAKLHMPVCTLNNVIMRFVVVTIIIGLAMTTNKFSSVFALAASVFLPV